MEHGDYKDLNDELVRLRKIVEDIVTYARLKKIPNQNRAEFAKKYFSPAFDINDTGLKLNAIGKTIKHLRVFIKDRVKQRIIKPIDLSDFKIPEEESDAIYLSYEEIAKIYFKQLLRIVYLFHFWPFSIMPRHLFSLSGIT